LFDDIYIRINQVQNFIFNYSRLSYFLHEPLHVSSVTGNCVVLYDLVVMTLSLRSPCCHLHMFIHICSNPRPVVYQSNQILQCC